MAFNGSGVFQRVRNWVADATAGVKIRADYHDAEDDGFAEGLSNCITKDGQTTITQNIPFNNKRATGLAEPVNAQDAATKAYADTKMSILGGTMTGDITIDKDNPSLVLDKNASGQSSSVIGKMGGKDRWVMRLGNDAAETGSDNAGSDFDLLRYADDGTLIEQALVISRSDGKMLFNGDLYAVRSATEGVIFLGGDGGHYLYWSGAYYSMPGAKLTLGGPGETGNDAVTWDQLATKQPALGFTPVRQGGGVGMMDNTVYIGWDGSQLLAQVDGVPQGPLGGIRSARFAYAGDVAAATGPQSTPYEPYTGAALTGWQWAMFGGYPLVTSFRARYLQVLTTSWFTVGYA